jgi:osmoprotectant transport system permease protein
MQWFLRNWELVGSLALDHTLLSITPLVLGAAIAVPLGWWANRTRVAGAVVLSLAGVMYTIPSIALFVLLPPLLNLPYLSSASVTIALTIYAVAVLARSATDGFASVDATVLDSATASGYNTWQRFLQVELPLAGPVIVAGLRVVSVSTVSLVTVGVLVGVPSLGYLFTDGFQRRIAEEIVVGLVATLALALILDALVVALGRIALPWAVDDDSHQRRPARTS